MEAHQRCRQVYDRAVRDGLTGFPAFGLLYVALALIALERYQLEEARELVEQGGPGDNGRSTAGFRSP